MVFDQLADRYWDLIAKAAPTIATVRGIHDYNEKLADLTEEGLDATASQLVDIASEVRALPRAEVLQDRINSELLILQCETAARDIEQRYLAAPVDPYLGPHVRLLNDTRQNTVQNSEQADALLSRYEAIPGYLTEALALQRKNSVAGMAPARASFERVISQLEGYIASPLDDDPFLALAHNEDWLTRAQDLVTETIRPAFSNYLADLREHIGPVARPDDQCGLMWIEGGEAIYESLIYKYTQTTSLPADIHQTGMTWATEINAKEWVEIGSRAMGLSTLDEIFERLHQDPDLRFKSEEQMLSHARTALERAWDAVDDWFGARPQTPCEVVPVPAATAPAMPPAYYMQPPVDGSRPGRYFLNTYRPSERDVFEYESIHFHEGIPGHHFDRSLASEMEGIPTFRRYSQVFAHTEGWGLYSERLADEMGLYSSDVDRLGMISADAWRAGRLVTDTGIHALGWSRQQAIDFLSKWTPIGKLTVEQEVDRYIGMPGQALSYKVGQLEIFRLRREAERQLGSEFDIKGFHDTMLVNGGMPLPMLSEAVETWIDTVR